MLSVLSGVNDTESTYETTQQSVGQLGRARQTSVFISRAAQVYHAKT